MFLIKQAEVMNMDMIDRVSKNKLYVSGTGTRRDFRSWCGMRTIA
jgi:hypothetical protein